MEDSSTTCVIRTACDSDAAAIASLLGELGYPNEVDAVSDRLRDLRSHADCHVLVALGGNDVCGVGTLHIYRTLHAGGHGALITALVVASDLRGRGIGQLLLVALERHASESGCDRIMVTTGNQRTLAHRFYERAGYRFSGRRYVKQL